MENKEIVEKAFKTKLDILSHRFKNIEINYGKLSKEEKLSKRKSFTLQVLQKEKFS